MSAVSTQRPSLAVPRGACDTHVHVFDAARFPFAASAAYKPQRNECGDVDDLATVLACHGIERVVIVNPTSGYGEDVSCMLDAVARLGPRARGIACAPLSVEGRTLSRWRAKGVAGVRVDLVAGGAGRALAPEFASFVQRLAERDMLLDLQCEGDQLAAVLPVIADVPVRVVVDHVGRPVPANGLRQPGFRALLALLDSGRGYVKLSGAMRFSRRPPPYADTDRYVRALLAAAGPERLVFGSDWPFLRTERRTDYGPALAQLAAWVPDAQARKRILVDTPARLFGFR